MGAALDENKRNLAHDVRIGDGAVADTRQHGREFGRETDAHAGCDHGHDPVLPLAPVGHLNLDAALDAKFVDMAGVFAVDAIEIGLARNIGNMEYVVLLEPVAG